MPQSGRLEVRRTGYMLMKFPCHGSGGSTSWPLPSTSYVVLILRPTPWKALREAIKERKERQVNFILLGPF